MQFMLPMPPMSLLPPRQANELVEYPMLSIDSTAVRAALLEKAAAQAAEVQSRSSSNATAALRPHAQGALDSYAEIKERTAGWASGEEATPRAAVSRAPSVKSAPSSGAEPPAAEADAAAAETVATEMTAEALAGAVPPPAAAPAVDEKKEDNCALM